MRAPPSVRARPAAAPAAAAHAKDAGFFPPPFYYLLILTKILRYCYEYFKILILIPAVRGVRVWSTCCTDDYSVLYYYQLLYFYSVICRCTAAPALVIQQRSNNGERVTIIMDGKDYKTRTRRSPASLPRKWQPSPQVTALQRPST